MTRFGDRPSRVGAVAMVALGMVVAISSFSIVRAQRVVPANTGTFNCSSGTACVTGSSTGSTTFGVYGFSKSDDGVHGKTTSSAGGKGVAGIATGSASGNGIGVYGSSTNGDGVRGLSTSPSGLAYGVTGFGSAGGGVDGEVSGSGIGGYGVRGYAKNAWGVFAESGGTSLASPPDPPALEAQGDGDHTWLFIAISSRKYHPSCLIDEYANLQCSGTIHATSLQEKHRIGNGQQVLSYASQSTTATIEDVGTARMYGGVANVKFDSAFASVIDRKWYYVFLTPLGDTRGLYVSIKTPSAFQVRETEHGRSSLEFDYRIVAHPLDAENDRLPLAPVMRTPSRIIHPVQ